MDLIHDFGLASGLKVHPAGHPKCSTCLVTNNHDQHLDLDSETVPQNLKYISNGIEVLGTAIGEESFVNNFTQKIIQEVKVEAQRIKGATQNYDQRLVLANYILLPKISFHSQFHGLTNQEKKQN